MILFSLINILLAIFEPTLLLLFAHASSSLMQRNKKKKPAPRSRTTDVFNFSASTTTTLAKAAPRVSSICELLFPWLLLHELDLDPKKTTKATCSRCPPAYFFSFLLYTCLILLACRIIMINIHPNPLAE